MRSISLVENQGAGESTTCCNYSGYRQLVTGGQERHQERNEIDLIDDIESLVRSLPDHLRQELYIEMNKNAHDKHHKIVIKLSANSYTTFFAFSEALLGDSRN